MHFQFWQNRRKQYASHWLVMGDLNTTPWSAGFQQFLAFTGLRDSQVGFVLQPSFPVWNSLMRIPIDHCLVSESLVVLNRELGPDVGSDHFPLIVEIGVK